MVISRPFGAPKSLDWFSWNLACLNKSGVRHHIQNAAAKGVRWGDWWSCTHVLFASLNAPTAFHETFSLNAPTCFASGCVPLGQFAEGVKFSPLYPKHFHWADESYYFAWELIGNAPFDDSSVKVAYWPGIMGTGKPNLELDFTYYLRNTWFCTCAMQILSINMEIIGPLNTFGTVKGRHFIFDRHIHHNKYLPSDDK